MYWENSRRGSKRGGMAPETKNSRGLTGEESECTAGLIVDAAEYEDIEELRVTLLTVST